MNDFIMETKKRRTSGFLTVNQEIRLQRQERNTAEREGQMKQKPPKAKGAAPAEELAAAPKAKGNAKTAEQKATEKLLADVQKKLEASESQVAEVTQRMAQGKLKERAKETVKAKAKVAKEPKETDRAIITT